MLSVLVTVSQGLMSNQMNDIRISNHSDSCIACHRPHIGMVFPLPYLLRLSRGLKSPD